MLAHNRLRDIAMYDEPATSAEAIDMASEIMAARTKIAMLEMDLARALGRDPVDPRQLKIEGA